MKSVWDTIDSMSRCITPPPFNYSTGSFDSGARSRACTPPREIRYNVYAGYPKSRSRAFTPPRHAPRAITPPRYVSAEPYHGGTAVVSEGPKGPNVVSVQEIMEMRPRRTVPDPPKVTQDMLKEADVPTLMTWRDMAFEALKRLNPGGILDPVYHLIQGFLLRHVPWLLGYDIEHKEDLFAKQE